MHTTYIPCAVCYDLLTYDPVFEDYRCMKCGPFKCIVSGCTSPVYEGRIVCPTHLCKNPSCDPSKNVDGEYVFFGDKLHITHLAKKYQAILKKSSRTKGITCTSDVSVCICHEHPEFGYERDPECRVVYKPVYGYCREMCAPCWKLNVCKGYQCTELVDVTDPEKKKRRFCKNGAGKCYTENPCGICTVVFCTGKSASKIITYYCFDCRANYNICYTCYRFEPKARRMLFSKVVFGANSSIERCVYCADHMTREVRMRAYVLRWRFMNKAVRSCIARNVSLSQRMTESNALWFFTHRDIITTFELDDLIHNADANATMERIISEKPTSKISTFALMYDVACLPLIPFLKVMKFLDGDVSGIL